MIAYSNGKISSDEYRIISSLRYSEGLVRVIRYYFFALYCAEEIPSSVPIKVSIAVIVPTICSA